jgi:hypothetical protein
MRIYHAFIVNEYFASFYISKPSSLFKMFEQIYNLSSNDLILGCRIFEQIAIPFNKEILNEYIYNKHCGELSYSRDFNKHIINNLYFDEISKITVYNYHVKIKSNINYPTFIDTLKDFEENIFICDFINKDYFWLDKISREPLVKN